MLNHSSAKQYEETPYIPKPTKNKTLKLNGSSTERKETPHANKSTKNKALNLNGSSEKTIRRSTENKTLSPHGTSKTSINNALRRRNGTSKITVGNNIKRRYGSSKTTISDALRRRAQSMISDKSIDAQSRAIIRYGLETNDPWLPELVRRVDGGGNNFRDDCCTQTPETHTHGSDGERSKR